MQVQRGLEILKRRLLARSEGEPGRELSHLVDDIRMISAERDVGVRVLGLDPHCLLQAVLDLSAMPFGERLGNRNALAVPPQRLRVEIPSVGQARRGMLQHLAPVNRRPGRA